MKKLLLILITSSLIFSSCSLFTSESPNGIHQKYSKKYEDIKKIQNIIGVDIPEFEVVDSRLLHCCDPFEAGFSISSIIEFKKNPDTSLYLILDSICNLLTPEELKKTSNFFYYSENGKERCLSNNGNAYIYRRSWDFGDKFLHNTNAYFYFTIKKDSREATIKYGDYYLN